MLLYFNAKPGKKESMFFKYEECMEWYIHTKAYYRSLRILITPIIIVIKKHTKKMHFF